jgi:hypothetical protein
MIEYGDLPPFKVGDTLRCIYGSAAVGTFQEVTDGYIYIVLALEFFEGNWMIEIGVSLTLEPIGSWWSANRFTYV